MDPILTQKSIRNGSPMQFSDESKTYMPNGRLEVARAMIHAGIETASQMQFVKSDLEEDELDADATRVLH